LTFTLAHTVPDKAVRLNNQMSVRSVALLFLFSVLAPGIVSSVAAKGWRGIVPLHTTRAEVEKLLGPPTKLLSEYSVSYRTENESLIITYARGLPCGIGHKYSEWRVPRDTVESIFITPNRGAPLSKLKVDESKYKKSTGGHRPEDIYYVNEQEGESLRVFMGEVMDISYSAAAGDEHLRCSVPTGSANKCEGFAAADFDTYEKISPENEKIRLDNFGIALTSQIGNTGYIIAYAGTRAHVGEALKRAQSARSYLAGVRKIPMSQLKAIDGGYRDKATVQLLIGSPGSCAPTAMPTVDPRDVQIIKSGRRKLHRSS